MNSLQEIPFFPFYYIDKMGNIYSKKGHGNQWGNFPTNVYKKIKFSLTSDGYYLVGLYRENKRVRRLVHRVVLETFIGKCPDGQEGCHNNGVRTDNRLSNLRWGSKADNYSDREKHGTLQFGFRNPHFKYSQKFVEKIVELKKTRTSKSIAEEYKMNLGKILYLLHRFKYNNNKTF